MYEGAVGSAGLWALALYQGTTLVGPLPSDKDLGFSPCAPLCYRHVDPCVAELARAGAEAQISRHLLWPD